MKAGPRGASLTGMGTGLSGRAATSARTRAERALVPAGAWLIDRTRSRVAFDVRHLKVLHVRGRFSDFAGTLLCDRDGATLIDGSVVVASIETGDARRDAALRGDRFFDVERHPSITFDGTAPPVPAHAPLSIGGSLTIRAVRRPLVLRAQPVPAAPATEEVRIHAAASLSRHEFGLDWEPAFAAGGLVIDDVVGLALDVVAVRLDG